MNYTRYPIRVSTLHAMTYTSFCKYFFAFLFFCFFGYNGYAYTKSQAGNITATDSVTNVSCNGGNNGAIDISVSGPNAPFTFLWSNSETTEDITNLSAGSYAVTIFDALGDSLNLSFVVSNHRQSQFHPILLRLIVLVEMMELLRLTFQVVQVPIVTNGVMENHLQRC